MSAKPDGERATVTSRVADEFWSRIRDGRLELQHCRGCGSWIWYPRPWCPRCGADDLAWEACSGQGRVYTFTVVRRPPKGNAESALPVLAYVELDEGPRLLTFVRGVAPEHVHVDMEVHAVCGAGSAPSLWFEPRPGFDGPE